MLTPSFFLLIGSLLLLVGLTRSRLQGLPLTTPMIYLAIGLLLGPTGLNAFHFNPLKQAGLLEALTEVAVLISLFTAGMKMPVPVRMRYWRTPLLLAFATMALCVALMTLFGYQVLGLPLGAAVLLGAVLAPTDPVLATDVQVRHPGDQDRLRLALTCEAGINDGSAFPFVILGLGLLGLQDLGPLGRDWLLADVLWATAGGVLIGAVFGALLARTVWLLQQRDHPAFVLKDFAGLGLIGLVYGLAELAHAWGFLAVFAAAVALRHTEAKLTERAPEPVELQEGETEAEREPRADNWPGLIAHSDARISDVSLAFKEQLERLVEVFLILLVGCSLFLNSWTWQAVAVALFLFFVARPLSVLLVLAPTRVPMHRRLLISWFGVRGIGSLFYLMYAITHGVPEPLALELLNAVLITVTLSILVHGLSIRPLLRHYEQRGAEVAH